ncbi:hypothetical protein ACJX0J_019260 [Zea mays]
MENFILVIYLFYPLGCINKGSRRMRLLGKLDIMKIKVFTATQQHLSSKRISEDETRLQIFISNLFAQAYINNYLCGVRTITVEKWKIDFDLHFPECVDDDNARGFEVHFFYRQIPSRSNENSIEGGYDVGLYHNYLCQQINSSVLIYNMHA